jgi:hypothetical protein
MFQKRSEDWIEDLAYGMLQWLFVPTADVAIKATVQYSTVGTPTAATNLFLWRGCDDQRSQDISKIYGPASISAPIINSLQKPECEVGKTGFSFWKLLQKCLPLGPLGSLV